MDITANSPASILFRHVLVIVAYALLAKLVLATFAANGIVSIVWPSSGVALAALLLGGQRYVPAVWAGAFLACLWAGNSLPVSLGLSIGNTLEPWLAFLLLQRLGFDPQLVRPRDYVHVAVAGAVTSVVAAAGGVFTLWLAGILPVSMLAENAMHWWQGDSLGIVLVTPLLLVWRSLPRGWVRSGRLPETVAFLLVMLSTGQFVFMHWFVPVLASYAEPYWVFLVLAWASVRFGRHGVLLLVAVTSVQHLLGILRQVGKVDMAVMETHLQNYWFFMLVLATVGMTLALAIYQRKHVQVRLLEMKDSAENSLRQLRESEDRYRILFEFSKDALVTSEPPLTNFTSGNREALLMFGLDSEAELRCYGPLDFSPEYQPDGQKSVDKALHLMRHALEHGYASTEWMHKRKNGEEFLCSILVTAISINGKIVLHAAMRDITLQKAAEKALREVNEQLEQRVQERTRELDASRLMAEKLAQEKTDFLANMSHEIRIPISSVLGMSYLALKTPLNKKQRDYVEKIQLSAQHLLGLIDSILDFSKLEAGQVVLENIDFGLDEVMDTLGTLVQEKASAKGLHVVVNIDPCVPRQLQGDPLRLAQILINYVNNAIKFTDKGDIVVHVSQSAVDNRGSLLRFEVTDQGIGISEHEQMRLFESFRQGDPSIARKYGGTGLGLAICKELAEMMGGEVGVSSMPGKGSTFWFTAHLGKGSVAAVTENVLKPVDITNEYRKILAGRRILLAEDNAINQQVASELLQLVGIEVVAVDNGRQAIEQLRQGKFDCVLMDVQMPEMDGLQATEAIRAEAALSGNIIIAMTANAMVEDHRRCLAAGMDDFVSKPVSPAHLYATIAKWLSGETSRSLPPMQVLAGLPDPADVGVAEAAAVVPVSGCHDPSVVDLGILALSLGNDEQQLREFVTGRFVPSTRRGLDEMHEALRAGDLAAMHRLGHKYKSSAKTVGAMGFADLCFSLEKLPEAAWQQQAENLLQQMAALLGCIDAAVQSPLDVS